MSVVMGIFATYDDVLRASEGIEDVDAVSGNADSHQQADALCVGKSAKDDAGRAAESRLPNRRPVRIRIPPTRRCPQLRQHLAPHLLGESLLRRSRPVPMVMAAAFPAPAPAPTVLMTIVPQGRSQQFISTQVTRPPAGGDAAFTDCLFAYRFDNCQYR